MRYSIFFAVLLKVIQDFGLRYFYSILPIVPQSQKIVDQNWPKDVKLNQYDRIGFIAASLHQQASLFDISAPSNRKKNSTKQSLRRVLNGTPVEYHQQYCKTDLGLRYFYYVTPIVPQTRFGVVVLLLHAILLFDTSEYFISILGNVCFVSNEAAPIFLMSFFGNIFSFQLKFFAKVGMLLFFVCSLDRKWSTPLSTLLLVNYDHHRQLSV